MNPLKSALLATGLGLVLVGVLAFLLQPGPPDSKCVSDNTASSGFVDKEKNCAISQDSWNEIADYESSPKPFRIVGLLLILAGIVVTIVAVIRRARSKGSAAPVSRQ